MFYPWICLCKIQCRYHNLEILGDDVMCLCGLYRRNGMVMRMCAYCDPNSDVCCIFQDDLTRDWYLNIQTCEWDTYEEDFVHQREYISYCPYCGRKLVEK